MPRKLSEYDLNDIVGRKYHLFNVLSYSHEELSKDGFHYYYNCLCDCGKHFKTHRRLIFKNKVKSCGCYALISSSINGKKRKKYNHYDLSGYFGIGYFYNSEDYFIFDLEDYDKIRRICWYKDANGYVVGNIKNRAIKLHRLIMNPNKNEVVDHINHNTLNNKKENLRVCTKQQNCMNRNAKGISYRKDCEKYRVRITIKGNKISVGNYNTIEEAIKARTNAENKYFKEYGYYNSMKGDIYHVDKD